MTDEWKLGLGVHDTFDRTWVLCHDFSERPYKAYAGTEDELIELCIKKNIEGNHTNTIVKGYFSDHYGVIKYQLDEHGLIARCREVWCPYNHKDEFGTLQVVVKQRQGSAPTTNEVDL